MEIFQNNFSGFIIFLVLGLRHGLDPDHIAVIDGYTYRLNERKSNWTPWVGTLFAFGHGVMVTVIALILSIIKRNIEIPQLLNLILEWIPISMLLMIGTVNVLSLIRSEESKTVSFRKNLLPDFFNTHLNPFSIILTGIVFGFIFDTSTQIAAFSFAVSAADQWLYAVIGGIIFSFGLMLTGTFDSFYLSKLLKTFDQKKISNHRFKLNVLITIMCFVIPFYKITCFYNAAMELSDFQNNLAGIGFICIILLLYAEMYIKHRKTAINKQ